MKPIAAFEEAVRRAVRQAFGVDVGAVPTTIPPTAELGDFATPICFELARTLRRPPRALAEGIAAGIAAALEAEGAAVTRIGRRPDKLGADGFTADVTDRASVDAAFAAARSAKGPITILVASAGAAEERRPVVERAGGRKGACELGHRQGVVDAGQTHQPVTEPMPAVWRRARQDAEAGEHPAGGARAPRVGVLDSI